MPRVLIAIAIVSFVPAMIYLVIIRNSERYGREKWRTVLGAFFWGILAALMSVFLELFADLLVPLGMGLTALVVAPVVEEVTKPLIFFGTKEREAEDLIIKCASSGIGFACLENFLYFSGAEASLLPLIVFIRTLDGFMMHSATSGFTGAGIARGSPGPYLILAMMMHSLSNFLVSFGIPGITTSILFSMAIFGAIRALISRYDKMI